MGASQGSGSRKVRCLMFIGHIGRKILYVGTEKPIDSPFEVLEVKDSGIPHKELIDSFEVRRGEVLPKSLKSHKELRVAFVGVWKIHCGISTFSEWLWGEMAGMVGEYKIFAEVPLDGRALPEDTHVTRCWRRGSPLTELIKELKAYQILMLSWCSMNMVYSQ